MQRLRNEEVLAAEVSIGVCHDPWWIPAVAHGSPPFLDLFIFLRGFFGSCAILPFCTLILSLNVCIWLQKWERFHHYHLHNTLNSIRDHHFIHLGDTFLNSKPSYVFVDDTFSPTVNTECLPSLARLTLNTMLYTYNWIYAYLTLNSLYMLLNLPYCFNRFLV